MEQQFSNEFVTGYDEKLSQYVTKDKKTGELLNSDNSHIETGDDFAFFEIYDGPVVNGKREGLGQYKVMDISEGQSNLEYLGNFHNNLPHGEGILELSENGQFITKISGYFVNGLPDPSKTSSVIYKQRGSNIIKINKMEGTIVFDKKNFNKNKVNPEHPYLLLDTYLSSGFEVTGTNELTVITNMNPGVFSQRGEKIEAEGGRHSRKRNNHKKRNSLKK
jgi:hypothetical protein